MARESCYEQFSLLTASSPWTLRVEGQNGLILEEGLDDWLSHCRLTFGKTDWTCAVRLPRLPGSDKAQGWTDRQSVRIGLTHGADRLLRFYERGSEYISGPRRLLKE